MIEIHYICDCCRKSMILVAQENAVDILYSDHKVKFLVDNNLAHLNDRDRLADERSCRIINAVPLVKLRLCEDCAKKLDQYLLEQGRDHSRFNIYNLWKEFYDKEDHR